MEEDAAHQMGKMVRKRGKPIVVHSLYSSARPHSLHLLRYYGIPVYDSLDVACKCTGVLAEYGRFLGSYHPKAKFTMNWGAKTRRQGEEIIERARSEGRTGLLEHEAKRLLGLHGVPVPLEHLARSAEEASDFAARVGGPVALKVVSPRILHKSDAGGVLLGLEGEETVRDGYHRILETAEAHAGPDPDVRGVLVSPMAEEGVEVIVGTKEDDQFGPIIMFGLGGVLVEVLRDVSFRVLPISPTAARKMIREIRSYPLLQGVRGRPPCDEKALRRLLSNCSEVIESYPAILEMDLNPVVVHPNGLSVVDARILLRNPAAP
jgi:acetyltransferase